MSLGRENFLPSERGKFCANKLCDFLKYQWNIDIFFYIRTHPGLRNNREKQRKISIADPGCLSRVPDPNFSIPDPESRVKKIPDPAIKAKNLSIFNQGFGSGSGLDPYSIGPVDPDPYSESGSGSRRAKMTHNSRKNSCFEVLDGLFCELQLWHTL